jgi:hypothetical protein
MALFDTQVIIRDLTANRPAATATPLGAIFIEQDLRQRIFRNNGATWDLMAALSPGPSQVTLLHPLMAASAPATNLAAATAASVSDPNLRQMVDFRGVNSLRVLGRIGGSLVAATKLRVQYHVGGNPAVADGDGGWTTLVDSAGGHTLDTLFYTAEAAVPAGAQINHVLVRAQLYDGDGAADPTISACVLNVYP